VVFAIAETTATGRSARRARRIAATRSMPAAPSTVLPPNLQTITRAVYVSAARHLRPMPESAAALPRRAGHLEGLSLPRKSHGFAFGILFVVACWSAAAWLSQAASRTPPASPGAATAAASA